MWRELLDATLSAMQQFNLQPQPPCSKQELDSLDAAVFANLNTRLPREYTEFLSIANGLDWNGLVILADKPRPLASRRNAVLEGIVEANLIYRDNPDMQDYLVLGEDGTVLFCQSVKTAKFVTLLAVGMTELESHETCGELLSSALKAHLP